MKLHIKPTRSSFTMVLFMLLTGTLLFSCSSRQLLDTSSIKTIDVAQLDKQGDSLEALTAPDELKEPLIIKIPAGFALPLEINIATPLATMASNDNKLIFSKDLYLFITSSKILASPDSTVWVPVNDIKELKSVFGLGEGEFSVKMSAAKEDGAVVKMHLQLHKNTP